LLLTIACDSPEEPRMQETAEDFLPLSKGNFHIYDVTEIKYELGVPETLAYELKTLVIDSFPRNGDGFTYVIHRSTRPDSQAKWTYLDTWSSYTEQMEAVTQEENTAFIKFKLPFVEGLSWNGNAYNNFGDDAYNLDETRASKIYGGTSYNDCFTVTQNDNEDFVVFLDQRQEVYARNVGLVYKAITQLHYCTQTESGCLGMQVVEQGLIYRQTIKDHGTD
jgi:hypothetical protein